jgi:cyclopentanol dehydrogenase
MRFAGTTVVVTGAGKGIGAALAQGFAAEGAVTYLASREESACREVAEAVRGAGGEARLLALEVTEERSWIEAVRRVEVERGKLDVLVNNAGINIRGPLEEYPVDAFDRMMAVNVRGVFLGMKHAVGLMRRTGGGSIVNLSSVAGLVGHRFTPIPYIATKGAVTLMTKGVAVQYAPYNIRVNSVHPSTVETALVAEMLKDPIRREERLGEIPMGRLATVEDVARAVLFLASKDAAFITGVSLPVDGGLTAS